MSNAPDPIRPVTTPTPDDFRRWWRETGGPQGLDEPLAPSPEMLLTANAWAEAWATETARAVLVTAPSDGQRGATEKVPPPAVAQPAATPSPPADGEGVAAPTINDIWDLCEEYEFGLGGDGSDEEVGAEILRDMILTALARWGRPAPPPAEGAAMPVTAKMIHVETRSLASLRRWIITEGQFSPCANELLECLMHIDELRASQPPTSNSGQPTLGLAEMFPPGDQEIEEWADASDCVPPVTLVDEDDDDGYGLIFRPAQFYATVRAALARWGRPDAVVHPGLAGVEVARLAYAAGWEARTVKDSLVVGAPPADPIRTALERLLRRLDETKEPEAIPAWMDSYCAARAVLAAAPPAMPLGQLSLGIAESFPPGDDEIKAWADNCESVPPVTFINEFDGNDGYGLVFRPSQFYETVRAALARWGRPATPAPAAAQQPLDLDALLSPEGPYEPGTGQEAGAQLCTNHHGGDPQWWAPVYGCDTLDSLLYQIRERILPHLRPPIAGIDVPGGDGDYGDVLDLCGAERVDPNVGVPLLQRARKAWFPGGNGAAAQRGGQHWLSTRLTEDITDHVE